MLAAEVQKLGLSPSGSSETGVALECGMADAMRLCLNLRTAHRVLWSVGNGTARDPVELHTRLTAWPWEKWVPADGYISITTSGQNQGGNDPRFVALKVKDAIVDRLNRVAGRRPDSGPDKNRTVVHVHWEGRFFTAYFDLAGEALSHRGYRLQPFKAPMRETLAAACILGAGWDPATTLVNPMCGSGTLAIEAALIASRTPPGYLRDNFGFMHLRGYEASVWKSVREQAMKARLARPLKVKIFASDLDPEAVKAAKANAERAGVTPWIEFAVNDFAATVMPPPPGLVIFNPEYGERLGESPQLTEQYKAIGDFMKNRAQGFTGAVFTGNAEMIKPIGLKPRERHQLFNGPIECRLLVFDLYGGTKRDRRLRPGGKSEA